MFVILNLTPHIVNICNEAGERTLSLKSHGALRLIEKEKVVGDLKGIKLVQSEFKDVTIITDCLPPIYEGKDMVVIVSLPVLMEFKRNKRLLEKAKKLLEIRGFKPIMFVVPHTGEKHVVRNSEGQVIGTKAFKTI